MNKLLLVFVFLLLPDLAFGASFAKQSLFLSKTPVTEGETVLIHAVVANESNVKFTGSVVFKNGDTKIGSVAATIAAGGANTVSLSWKPSAGSHTVAAELTATDGTVVEKQSANFSIAEKPKPATAFATDSNSAAAIESSDKIQSQIGSLSPAAQQATKPAFTIIDGLRSGAADVLDSQIESTKKKIAGTPKTGLVAGESVTQDASINNPWGMALNALYTIYLYVLTVLRFVIGNAALFYPLLAIAFLYFLWRMFRRYRRPSYN